MNKRRWMLIGWLLITLALSGLAVMPAAWAMPTQDGVNALNFTVPTPTPPQTPTTQPPAPTSPPEPPVLPTNTASPADPPATQTPVVGMTATLAPGSSTPTVTSTPSAGTPTVTQTPTGTPSAATPATPATPAGTSVATETPPPDVTATTTSDTALSEVSSEASSEGELPPSDAGSTQTVFVEQAAEADVPDEIMPEPDKAGSGSWLFFGGVGLLLLGLVLLLVWRRQG